MMFDWSGLKDHRYFLITQIDDPLKYCNYALPIPSPIGLPFMPCDLANEYELSSTDETYTERGDIYLHFQQKVSVLHRILFPASHRPWEMTGKDYYQHVPYQALRPINCPLNPQDRPTVLVKYQDKYIGKIVQKTILNCCCITEIYQQFYIYDHTNTLLFRVVSKNPQNGHFLILPYWGFDKITYDIYAAQNIKSSVEGDTFQIEEQKQQLGFLGNKVGQIVHLFNGLAEFTSKNDKYGICFPQFATEQHKCLLVFTTFLIDYLLFSNF